MADYTATDVELVRQAWRNAACPVCGSQRAGCHVLTDEQLRDYRAVAVLYALLATGRLRPPGELLCVRTADGRLHHPADVTFVYEGGTDG